MSEVIELCVEGTKGAGKSTTIRKLKEELEHRGWVVEVVAVFADANQHAQSLGYTGSVPMFADPESHKEIAEFEVRRFAQARENFRHRLAEQRARRGVLIFDRGWMTFHAHVFDGQFSDPAWQKRLWEAALESAPKTLFIHTHPTVTLSRREGQLDEVSGLEEESRVVADWEKRLTFARTYREHVIASLETFEGTWADTLTAPLQYIFETIGFSKDEALHRATTEPGIADNAQHFLVDRNSVADALRRLEIEDATVLELGVGTGVITKEILALSPDTLVGVEIDPNLVPNAVRDAIDLHATDINQLELQTLFPREKPTLVAAPPYGCLPTIRRWIDEDQFSEVLLMVPETMIADFSDFEIFCRLDGDAFEPASIGGHMWILKGTNS